MMKNKSIKTVRTDYALGNNYVLIKNEEVEDIEDQEPEAGEVEDFEDEDNGGDSDEEIEEEPEEEFEEPEEDSPRGRRFPCGESVPEPEMHGSDGGRASLRRIQHERDRLEGGRTGLSPPVLPGEERDREALDYLP